MPFLNEREIILFQGDSVTDCGRNYGDVSSLGTGYAYLISSCLSATRVYNEFTFINKGISGNRACDLDARWETDCVSLKPTVVSILIGINDTWRKFDADNPTSAETFENHYRNILNKTEAKIILLEPFLLPVFEERRLWREDLDPKIQVVRKLAAEFNALYVPLDGLFAAACAKKPPSFWAADGVHPSNAGHWLIADAWINSVK